MSCSDPSETMSFHENEGGILKLDPFSVFFDHHLKFSSRQFLISHDGDCSETWVTGSKRWCHRTDRERAGCVFPGTEGNI